MSGIRFEGVGKRFGDVPAVDEFDLEIEAGEFVSILGPSGCGKTTLLRMLAGLEQPSEGKIFIGGAVVNELPPAERNVAMVFQTYALYPHMTVAGNIEYPLRKRRIPKAERAHRVREAAAMLELGELLGRKPRELSGGQQQRVALGRALVRNPAAFLLDEPLSNLDAKLRTHMRAELIRLHRRLARTFVYVTHDQLEAMTMSQRIAVLCAGRLQQFAPPKDIYARPVNDFVAGFIGTPSMNFLEGRLDESGTSRVFRCGDWSLPIGNLPLIAERTATDRRVRLGIRPEDIFLRGAGFSASPSTGDRRDAARVAVVEPTGHEAIVVFDYRGNELVARMGGDIDLRPNAWVELGFRAERLHVFSAGDGRRLNDDRVRQRRSKS